MDRDLARRAAVTALLVWGGSSIAFAGDRVVALNGARETYDCEGDGIVINGGRNTVTLRNCDEVSINGADNRVHAGRATKISVIGSGNKVTYTRGDDDPKVLNLGLGNTVTAGEAGAAQGDARADKKQSGSDTRASGGSSTVVVDGRGGVKVDGPGGTVTVGRDGVGATSSGDALVLAEDRQTGTHNCHGGDALVSGDRNTFSFRDCAKVVVSGDRNTIDTRGAQAIDVSGDRNTVTWRGEKPRVSDSGEHNDVAGK